MVRLPIELRAWLAFLLRVCKGDDQKYPWNSFFSTGKRGHAMSCLPGRVWLRECQGHECQHLDSGAIGGEDHCQEPVLQEGRFSERCVLGLSAESDSEAAMRRSSVLVPPNGVPMDSPLKLPLIITLS